MARAVTGGEVAEARDNEPLAARDEERGEATETRVPLETGFCERICLSTSICADCGSAAGAEAPGKSEPG